MFDIGMTELLVIGIVALIVVGPKDLPGMFRTLGRFTGKMRGMAREFQQAMNDAADEAGVKEIGKDLKGMANPKRYGLDKLNEATESFEKWDPAKATKGGRGAPAGQAGETSDPAKTTGAAADTPLARQADAAPLGKTARGAAAASPAETPSVSDRPISDDKPARASSGEATDRSPSDRSERPVSDGGEGRS